MNEVTLNEDEADSKNEGVEMNEVTLNEDEADSKNEDFKVRLL